MSILLLNLDFYKRVKRLQRTLSSLNQLLSSFSYAVSPLIASSSISFVCFALRLTLEAVLTKRDTVDYVELAIFYYWTVISGVPLVLSLQLSNKVRAKEHFSFWTTVFGDISPKTSLRKLVPGVKEQSTEPRCTQWRQSRSTDTLFRK